MYKKFNLDCLTFFFFFLQEREKCLAGSELLEKSAQLRSKYAIMISVYFEGMYRWYEKVRQEISFRQMYTVSII